ncbi:hypothetical protein FJZ28_00210 [Candidatus Peregrinibacteria bacterium]|nr:hypothetical protein [Candidatus Peregrinibacteria bacterium]
MCCCDPKNPKSVAALLLRVTFGLSLLFVGISHYMRLQGLVSMMDGLGPLTVVGQIWAYILPALMIVGGALFAIGMYLQIGTWAAGVALASIPAGMMLQPVLSPVGIADMMGATINAFIWLIVFALVVRTSCCSCGDCSGKCGCK